MLGTRFIPGDPQETSYTKQSRSAVAIKFSSPAFTKSDDTGRFSIADFATGYVADRLTSTAFNKSYDAGTSSIAAFATSYVPSHASAKSYSCHYNRLYKRPPRRIATS